MALVTPTVEDMHRVEQLEAESAATFRRLGDVWGLALALHCLSFRVEPHDRARARQLQEESLLLFRSLHDPWGAAVALNGLGEVARAQGDYDAAATAYAESLVLAREMGSQREVMGTTSNLAFVALHQRDPTSAMAYFAEFLHIARDLNHDGGIAAGLAGTAAVATERGDAWRAAQLFGAAEAARHATGTTYALVDRQEFDRYMAFARDALGDAAFSAAYDEGQVLALDDAITLALEQTEHGVDSAAAGNPG